MALLRTFVALEFSPKVRRSIAHYIEALRRYDHGIRWTAIDNIHLTVKFIGDTPEDQISQISQILREICAEISPFKIKMEDVGSFPNDKNPKILWIGMNDTDRRIENLAESVNHGLQRAGISPDTKRFKSHVTIGRVKKGNVARTIAFMRQHPFPETGILLNECVLMKSELAPKGPEYTALDRFPFG